MAGEAPIMEMVNNTDDLHRFVKEALTQWGPDSMPATRITGKMVQQIYILCLLSHSHRSISTS